MYKTITIKAGSGGWGGPLTIVPTEKCNKILSVTGGGVHPVAQKIAEMTGGEAVDGFKETLPDDEVLVAVVDCGGTARCGVYPKKGIFTVNIEPVGKAGPLHQRFMYQQLQKVTFLNLIMLAILHRKHQKKKNSHKQVLLQSQNQKHRQKKKLQKQTKEKMKISLSVLVKLLDVL